MLIEIINFIKEVLKEFGDIIELIDITEQLGHKVDKVEIVISSNNFMGSISIYSNNVYDFLAVEVNNEEIMLNSNNSCEDFEDLKCKVKYELRKFSKL
ncbi:hypothetical protein [Inconstantimicrobium mannanitabidum]|uniref:Uncharacterized protein n=1 Tax=Inconstantimicrobium mannanitabidum TaxID=1604901 RepID=A0ACB5R7V1_9CLOT|nr:hypothetical protein [Clostridium sp. TW13]GKX65102.1 hypothetical protein rsdtw13_03600 [Clostridium sp. TW13]